MSGAILGAVQIVITSYARPLLSRGRHLHQRWWLKCNYNCETEIQKCGVGFHREAVDFRVEAGKIQGESETCGAGE